LQFPWIALNSQPFFGTSNDFVSLVFCLPRHFFVALVLNIELLLSLLITVDSVFVSTNSRGCSQILYNTAFRDPAMSSFLIYVLARRENCKT
jgi:hypothetical protein